METIEVLKGVFLATFSLETILALLLTLMPKLGKIGKETLEILSKAPGIDIFLSILIWVPWLVSSVIAGWLGLGVAIVAQLLSMQLWIFGHELAHREAVRGPRIVRFLDQQIGWWRNHIALWSTLVALPAFFLIRFAQLTCYPVLVWALDFPQYKDDEWVNVSRYKFDGLVGHDLIWCLYCDWMTGVYALGAEMLRNLESFWCPIRFYEGKKCENCKLDFPDIERGWIPAEGTMKDVEQLLQQMYSSQHRSWFGHQQRQHHPLPPKESPNLGDSSL